MKRIVLIVWLPIVTMSAALGASRTTPVTVENSPVVKLDPAYATVKLDSTGNIVRARQDGTWTVDLGSVPILTVNTHAVTQSGTWNVGVTSMPTVNVNTHPVTQSGTWTVGLSGTPNVNVANTPSVNVANSPVVKIDSSMNAVDTPTRHNTIQLWSTNQTVAAKSTLYSPYINCAGYDRVRAVLWCTTAASCITVYINFRAPTGYFASVMSFSWPSGTIAAVECPVYGDTCRIDIMNNCSSSITMSNDSYVYLVN